jgi:hypothetical protein
VTERESRVSLEDLAARRGAKQRDCRDCQHFDPQGDTLSYGWCKAHSQFVKLYHPAGQFFSQCQFKALTRERAPRAL